MSLVHWWATGSEAAAFDVLRQSLGQKGIACQDVSIAGGANMLADLEAMVARGDIPTGTVLSGYGTHFWAQKGVLATLNEPAERGGWDAIVPQALQRFCRWNGQWIGVPICLHSINWLWVNAQAARSLDLKAPPRTLTDLFAALDKARAAGLIPLAIGGQDWLIATLFDTLVLASQGRHFYQQAFMNLDEGALTSQAMREAFELLARLAGYADRNHAQCSWHEASAKVIGGQALLEVSGDWVRAAFASQGLQEGEDYWAVRFPQTEGLVLFNADIITLFEVEPNRQHAQTVLAETIMDQAVQTAFNAAKGAAVPRIDGLGPSGADGLIGSMAHGYAQPDALQQRYFEIVVQVFKGRLSPQAAPKALLRAFNI